MNEEKEMMSMKTGKKKSNKKGNEDKINPEYKKLSLKEKKLQKEAVARGNMNIDMMNEAAEAAKISLPGDKAAEDLMNKSKMTDTKKEGAGEAEDVKEKFSNDKKDMNSEGANRDQTLEMQMDLEAARKAEALKQELKTADSTSDIYSRTTFIEDYAWSMEHFLENKSEFVDLEKYDIFVSPDGLHCCMKLADVFGGKTFKGRKEFWQERESLIARFVVAKSRIRLKMETDEYIKYLQAGSDLVSRFEILEFEAGRKLFQRSEGSLGNINLWTSWYNADKEFYTQQRGATPADTNHLIYVDSTQLGNNSKLTRRRAITKYAQPSYVQPYSASYGNRCLTNLLYMYKLLAAGVPTGNLFQIIYGRDEIVSEKNISLFHLPTLDLDISPVLDDIYGKVPSLPYTLYKIMLTICRNSIIVTAGKILENTQMISSMLQGNITIVSKLNTMASTVYSVNAEDLLVTFAAACSLRNVFVLTANYDTTTVGYQLNTVMQILTYMIYTPSPLIDQYSIITMKEYLFQKLMGVYNFNPGAQYAPFDVISRTYGRPVESIPTFEPFNNKGKRSNIAVNSGYNNYRDYAAISGPSAIKALFDWPFARIPTINGPNVLFEGEEMSTRFSIVVNFLGAIASQSPNNSYININERSRLNSMREVLVAQFNAYRYYCQYLTSVVDILMSLGISTFTYGGQPISLNLDPIKLMGFTVNLATFDLTFSSSFHKIKAWSYAFKAELGMMHNVYNYYWNQKNYYIGTIIISSKQLATFLKPIISKYDSIVTTKLAKYILAEYWESLNRIPEPKIDTRIWDFLGVFGNQMQSSILEVDDLINRSGYTDVITYNALALFDINIEAGIQYVVRSDKVTDGNGNSIILSRPDLQNKFSVLPSAEIHSGVVNFPCFRIVPKWLGLDEVDAMSEKELMDKIREDQGVIDIPLYLKWAVNSRNSTDMILIKDPLIKPIGFEPMEFFDDLSRTLLGRGGSITYINNEASDILFKCHNDIDSLIKVTYRI